MTIAHETAVHSRPLQITPNGIELPASLFTPDLSFEAIEAELRAFEETERARLGLVEEAPEHWNDPNPKGFTMEQRQHTTLLVGGLTQAQDIFVQAAFAGLGYKVQALEVPDTRALHLGKEFGNRGQCNPTYFTVGNLVKTLVDLRDKQGLTQQEIVDNYLFLTAGSCGPCRFGTYVTEYRKALRDAGFEGFRVMLFEQQGGLKQATGADAAGLELNPKFFVALLKALMTGDVLNALGYRIRPYEVEPGATNRALQACRGHITAALEQRTSIVVAMLRCRRELAKVEVDRLQAKPKVSIIGEFWAMTTEGDGNYKLQQFLESEGAEVDVQLVTAWLLYNIWQHVWDTKRRMTLRGADHTKHGLGAKDVRKKLVSLWFADKALRGVFQSIANLMGLHGYHLPDMDEIASISHQYYLNELRGGEGHMEVGKLIQTVQQKKAHMVISVKPFGCMPSSGVSDGVQSLVVKKYPDAVFCPIETSGDGAVNVQSRVQMFLFKARRKAREELDAALAERGWTVEQAAEKAGRGWKRALRYPKHMLAGTAANVVAAL
jgi:predicted nucleotide-binding protein (sugar kinase/HSP70/actin superfamily)